MEETAESIFTWHKATFPGTTPLKMMKKLSEEVTELTFAVAENATIPYGTERKHDIPGEIANCMIVLISLACRYGIAPLQAIQEKMEINRKRDRKKR
ncbi:MAG: hypothetical protein HQL56_01035 [Magnetococcales bacterium]|nr:hypothetical protein [Magnetococcales bacterium]